MKVRMLFLLILSVIFLNTNAKPAKGIQITINNHDQKLVGQTIKVEYFKAHSAYGNWPATKIYNIVVKEINSSLRLNFPDGSGYIKFTFPDTYSGNFNRRTIYAENGDDIKLNIKNGKVRFEGAQSAGYNCQIDINGLTFTTRNYGHKGKIDSSYLNIFMEDHYTFGKKKLDVLNHYKPYLSKNKFNVILKNIEYETELNCISMLRTSMEIAENDDEKNCCYRFLKRFLLQKQKGISQEAMLSSNSYFDYLLLKEVSILDLYIYKNGNINKFRALFENINKNYQGKIKDRLITSTIVGDISFRDNADYFRKKALKIVKDPFSISALQLDGNIFAKGMPAFDFQLQDTLGRYVKLSDYRGKTVVLDFYFNGCTGCAHLAKGMDEVIPKFKDNPNVVFISISVDKTMDLFKEGIKSGKYTNRLSLNLYTNGMGENHELIKHYSIQGYPFLMIIDASGNILNSNPPYPSFGKGYTERFISLINESLATNSKKS